MTGKPNDALRVPTRRSLLQAATGAAGAAFAFAATPERVVVANKLSRKVVAYQDHPEGEKRCDRCLHFQPPSACKLVDGTVSGDGYCRFFTPRGAV